MDGRGRGLLIPGAVLLAVALLAATPMLLQGPSCGHDFDFHLVSWLEAQTQLVHGAWPRWAYTPGWNAGEARFVFYPPLSWLLGAALGTVLPWGAVPAAFTGIALLLAGAAFYRLSRGYGGRAAAMAGAALYMVNPYMLFTAYERTAYGELLAAAVLPLLLWAALAEQVEMLEIALPVALLWLTNAPAAVMGCYALAFVMLLRLLRREEFGHMQTAFRAMGGVALGLALAAFYIVPAAYEQRYVQIDAALTVGMRVSDHFLFYRMGGTDADSLFHDAVVKAASIVCVLLLSATGVLWALVARAGTAAQKNRALLPGALAAAMLFLLTPWSVHVWHWLPQMAFLQFPWRLGALLGCVAALMATLAAGTLRGSVGARAGAVAALCAGALLTAPAWHEFRQACDAEDELPARVALFHSNAGTEPTEEYTPRSADADALSPGDPPYWLVHPGGSANAPANVKTGGAPARLELTLPQPEVLVLNRREYPLWRVTVNGVLDTERVQRADGLIAVPLPAGHAGVEVSSRYTADEMAGMGISGAGAVTALALWRRRRSA